MAGFDEVTIAAPGNLDPKRIPVAAVQVSWGLSEAGAFSGFIRLDDLRDVGLGGDLKGFWVTCPTSAGLWGGVITGRPVTNGVVEIAASGYAALAMGRVIRGGIMPRGAPGGLARRALFAAGAVNPTLLRIGTIEEGGAALAMEFAGDVGADILPSIASAGDVEWVVDAERTFHLARRLGRDRSASVRLVEDRHISDSRCNDDLASAATGDVWRVQSELSLALTVQTAPRPSQAAVQPPTNPAVPTSDTTVSHAPRWAQAMSGVTPEPGAGWNLPEGVPAGSSATPLVWPGALGQWQRYRLDDPGVASAPLGSGAPPAWAGFPVGVSANHPGVPSQAHAGLPTVATELTLANVDDCFLAFDIGDTVRVELGSVGVTGRFRAHMKALDVASQSLTVSGELLVDV